MLSAIQTRNHFIRSFHFDSNEVDPKDEFESPQLIISQKHWRNDNYWYVALDVETEKCDETSNVPYTFKAVVEGVFEIAPSFPEDKLEDLVKMNGGAILYGTIRELVSNFSSRSLNGQAELPTIDARMFLIDPDESSKG